MKNKFRLLKRKFFPGKIERRKKDKRAWKILLELFFRVLFQGVLKRKEKTYEF